MEVWKKLLWENGEAKAPCTWEFVYKTGWNKPMEDARYNAEEDAKRGEVHGGALHALVMEPREYEKGDPYLLFVRCTAEPKDFIALGKNGDVALKRLHISVGDLKTAIRRHEEARIREWVD